MSVSLLMGWGLLVLMVLLVVALVVVLVMTRGSGKQQDGMSSPAQEVSANVFERGALATAAAPTYWPVLPAGSGQDGLPASSQGWQGAVAAGGPSVGQPGLTRSPIAVWLLLPVITLGIYSYVWYYKINRELRDFHPAIQVDPTLALLAMFVPFVGFVSLYNTGKRIGQAQQLSGLDKPCSGGLGILACFAFGLHAVYYQSQLNRLWAQQGA